MGFILKKQQFYYSWNFTVVLKGYLKIRFFFIQIINTAVEFMAVAIINLHLCIH